MSMNLKVLLPDRILLERSVTKVVAEGENGFFALLPRHVDFVAALVPSIFAYVTADDEEHFVAMDEGILVKQSDQVHVSTARGVPGDDLEELRDIVERELRVLGESEQKARSVIARLEMDTLLRFTRLGGEGS